CSSDGEEAIEGGEPRDRLTLVVGGDGQEGAFGGGNDGRRLVGQDHLAAGSEHPRAGGDGARRDAERAADGCGAAEADLQPASHHPAALARGCTVERLIQDRSQDAAVNDAREALKARVWGELGDDGVTL